MTLEDRTGGSKVTELLRNSFVNLKSIFLKFKKIKKGRALRLTYVPVLIFLMDHIYVNILTLISPLNGNINICTSDQSCISFISVKNG